MKLGLTIGLLLMSLFVQAQVNLVPNGSFEEYDTCPVNPGCGGHIEYATGWYAPITCSTDFFHNCASPNGCYATNTYNGDGMAGMFVFGGGGTDSREYAAVGLIEPLVSDSLYQFSVRLRVLNGEIAFIGSYGAYFSVDTVTDYSNLSKVMDVVPQLQRDPDSLMGDPNIWYLWEDTLIADGGEQFMIIGNFLNDSMTPVYQPGWQPASAYVLDDVQLVHIVKPKPNGVKALDKITFEVWPNPVSDVLHIELTDLAALNSRFSASQAPLEMTVVDMAGKQIWNTTPLHPSSSLRQAQRKTSGFAIDVSGWSSGMYFLKGTDDEGRAFTVKVVKE